MNHLVRRKFETKLGIIECELMSDKSDLISIGKEKYENGNSDKYQTEGHHIELIECQVRTHEVVKDSKGWLFRITKINQKPETLKIKCQLKNPNEDIEFDTASGEHLDAIEGYNQEWQLHIGTEDGEVMYARAEKNDWFPERLRHKVNFYESITQYLEGNRGFQTEIPKLEEKEKIYIHYLTAIDLKDDRNINCWNAVDSFKRNLENWIGIW